MALADIKPANATVTSSTAPTTTTSSGLTAVQVAVANMSQALQNLSHAIQTNATPVAAPNGNTLTLATALGNITVTLPQLSATEQQNIIQLLTALAQAQRPLTIALQPGTLSPTQAVLLLPTTNTPTLIQNSPAALSVTISSSPSLSLATGQTLSAIVLPSFVLPSEATVAQSSATLPPALTPQIVNNLLQELQNLLPENDPVQAPIPSSVAPPAPQNAALSTPPPPTTQPPAPQTAVPPSPSLPVISTALPATLISTLLQPGNAVTLRLDAVLPTTTTVFPALASNQIVATVSGTGTDGQLILRTADATLFVKTQIFAPIGTAVIVTVEAAKDTPLLVIPPHDSSNFPSLPETIAALAQVNPVAWQQIMTTHLPQPTENLPGALLFLFSAFKQGSVRGWLGDTAADSLLRAGKFDLISSLSRELGGTGQTAQDSVVGEWHSYPIPLYAQQQFQALTLYVHNDNNGQKQKGNGAAGAGKVRFVIDMKLSKLGEMQIDGFVQPKKLDMILRSDILLPEGLHNSLRTAYIKAVEAVGYTGSLNFQVGRYHWMVMQKAAAPRGIMT